MNEELDPAIRELREVLIHENARQIARHQELAENPPMEDMREFYQRQAEWYANRRLPWESE